MQLSNQKIIGITRIRNEEEIISHTLDHLSKFLFGVIIFDDSSTDETIKIIEKHSIVLEIIRGQKWETNPKERAKAEGYHRQIAYEKAMTHNPDWIYCFDADEIIEFDWELDLTTDFKKCYHFRLFDYYITNNDVNKDFLNRKFIGPEYREIPMLFHNSLKLSFLSRVPVKLPKSYLGGYVKHYGKAISVKAWELKCNYYINSLYEKQPGDSTISLKWKERIGKAIHSKSDFGNSLITWEEKETQGMPLDELRMLNRIKPLNILIASHRLSNLGGSETFTYALAEELIRRELHSVEYFTFEKGMVSNEMEKNLNINFMSKSSYDLILANHNTVVEFLEGKGFLIQTCHGIFPRLEQPSNSADAFVSISEEVNSHLAEKGFASKIIHNGINVNRFRIEKPINKQLKTVLSLCHSIQANSLIKEVCADLNLNYLEAYKYNDAVFHIEKVINDADLVIGLGRSAYEAMSCGRPVIIFDDRDYFDSLGDGYIRDTLGLSLKKNCSGRYFKINFSKQSLKEELSKYNPEDSSYYREFALKELNIENNVNIYLDYYYSLKNIPIKASSLKPYLKRKLGYKLYEPALRLKRLLRLKF